MAATIIGGAPFDWTLDTDEEGNRNYSLYWRVQTDGPSYGPDSALFAPGLPAPGVSLNVANCVDNWAFYNRRGSAKLERREAHRSIWIVRTDFSTRPVTRCQTSSFDNPLLEPPKIRGQVTTFQREVTRDKDGNALLNAAGQRFRGPAVTVEDGWPTLDVEQNVAWINPTVLGSYRYAVNDATFWGCAARTLKCVAIEFEQRRHGTCTVYYNVRSRIVYNADKWDLVLLNEGDLVRVPGTNPPRFRRAKDDLEENVHVLLDAHGAALAPGASPVYLTKRVYPERNFSLVGWPMTVL